VALYEAKRLGKGRFAFFTTHASTAVNQFTLVQELRQALQSEALHALQPIFDLTDEHIVGFEALMRWHHRPAVDTSERLHSAAEQSELILELATRHSSSPGRPALVESTSDYASDLFVTVNLSAANFTTSTSSPPSSRRWPVRTSTRSFSARDH